MAKHHKFEGYFAHPFLGPLELLEFLAKGLKYILPPSEWDFSGKLKCSDYDPSPEFQHLEAVFRTFQPRVMRGRSDENKALKYFVSFHRGLSHPGFQRNLRCDRMSDFANFVDKQLRRAGHTQKARRVLIRKFMRCVREHFFGG